MSKSIYIIPRDHFCTFVFYDGVYRDTVAGGYVQEGCREIFNRPFSYSSMRLKMKSLNEPELWMVYRWARFEHSSSCVYELATKTYPRVPTREQVLQAVLKMKLKMNE